MKHIVAVTAAIFTTLVSAGNAAAQNPATEHGGHTGHAVPSIGSTPALASGGSPSTDAFKSANDKMHTGMAIEYTGDADTDFVRGMIPHHQGAVEMAKIVLQYGKDPMLRKLAQDIIRAQDEEIALMQSWLTQAKK